MVMKPVSNIVLIGAGKLAAQLGWALKQQDIRISQVFNRNPEHGKKLAIKLNSIYIDQLSAVQPDADLYLIAVADKAIPSVAAGLKLKDRLLVHTSGSLSLETLTMASSRVGVFYPLQTFSGRRHISFRNIPVCIEANHKQDEGILTRLGSLISSKVYPVSSEQRKIIHLTAVFANNFTNFMYTIAGDILRRHDIPFEFLQPLIKATSANARGNNDPFLHQTGPAVREDMEVIRTHREMLAAYPEYREIYQMITKTIIQYKKEHGEL